ncbi:protein tyrosine phosphatase, non-receptor type 11, partial [Halocaridina rubra]
MLKQYHFASWPDFGVPREEAHLLQFWSEIRYQKFNFPMVVHCSAGVGRTGTFIGLWNLIEDIKNDPDDTDINIKRAVLHMRESRPSTVQAK